MNYLKFGQILGYRKKFSMSVFIQFFHKYLFTIREIETDHTFEAWWSVEFFPRQSNDDNRLIGRYRNTLLKRYGSNRILILVFYEDL